MTVRFGAGDPKVKIHPYLPTLRCPMCKAPVVYSADAVVAGIKGSQMECVDGHSTSSFDVISYSIEAHFMGSYMVLVGAEGAMFSHPIQPATKYGINLHDFGVPSGVRIFDINLTANARFGTYEIFGNTRRRRPDTAMIWHQTESEISQAIAVGDGFEDRVAIFAMWMVVGGMRPGMLSLLTAFEAYEDSDLLAAIVPANVAAESTLYNFMDSEFNYLGKDKRNRFLVNDCTYATQRDVLLPYIVKARGFFALGKEIIDELKALGTVRNEVGHTGRPKRELTPKAMARYLSATLIAYHYFETLLLRPEALRKPSFHDR
jgi:hypothetical protein